MPITCKMKSHCSITYKNMKLQKPNLQITSTAESLQMRMNPNLMAGSSVKSNKSLMVFTGTGPEYSGEDSLNAITANFTLV